MPKKCSFEAPLAKGLEDVRAVRELVRLHGCLMVWPKKEVVGLASLATLALNSRVMTIFAEVYCTHQPDVVKAPSIQWVRREVGC